MSLPATIRWDGTRLVLLDQRQLPARVEFLEIDTNHHFKPLPAANVGKVGGPVEFSKEAWRHIRCVIAREVRDLERDFDFDTSPWRYDVLS